MNFNRMFLATPLMFSTMIWAQPAADPTLPHSESSFLKDAAAGESRK